MEKKKSTTPLIVIIVMLFISLLALLGYIIYDKSQIKENKSETEEKAKVEVKENTKKEEIKIENLEITSTEVTQLYNKISNANGQYCGVDDYYTNDKVEAKDISNSLAFNIALSSLQNKGINKEADITKEQMDTEIDSIFGKNYDYKHNMYSRCPYYPYNETSGKYEFKGANCGGICGFFNIKKIVRAEKTEENIYIYVRVVFVDSSTGTYYSDYNKTIKLDDLEKDVNGIATTSDNNAANGSLYKLTFTKEDQNMIFTSSELVK